LSVIPLDELADHAADILAHQRNARLWFGYLEGWMVTPQEEVRLRKVLRAFPCALICAFPCALSQAWKNEIDTIYTTEPHGDSDTDNNGGSVQHGRSVGYGHTGAQTSTH
jgi:hypothetical protein